ncbi:MAG: DUF4810 domain-containing protein, partial [Candidatus Delongbacteria bacterium]|nr:DUF4810 domain-containing protein [Candidatus Delongbacteria bacterium]
MKHSIILFCFLIGLAGCAPTALYYWDNYPQTLYKTVENPGPESMASHQETLLRIIEQSAKWGRSVPPGVYYELGYISYQEGRLDEAATFFELEVETYPEAAVFVDSYRQMLTRSAGTTEEDPDGEEVESEK